VTDKTWHPAQKAESPLMQRNLPCRFRIRRLTAPALTPGFSTPPHQYGKICHSVTDNILWRFYV